MRQSRKHMSDRRNLSREFENYEYDNAMNYSNGYDRE